MELTDKNYQDIIKGNDRPVFIDFYSDTCAPCQVLLGIIEAGLEKYGEENGVVVATCNTGKNPKLAGAFNVRSVPFSIVVMPDEKLKYPEIGLKDQAYYYALIDKLSGKKKGLFGRLFG
jgi:thioredoxin-like negative regulator of GroEL